MFVIHRNVVNTNKANKFSASSKRNYTKSVHMHQNKTTVVHKTDREERLNFVTSYIHEM